MTESLNICDHCSLPIPPGDLVTDRIDGEEYRFCCQGCRGAFHIITGNGMAQFYRRRDWQEPGLPEGAFEDRFDADFLQRFVSTRDGISEISFLVEGIRCASCVWLNEKILAGIPGVVEARLNYGTHRARVRFDPEQIGPNELFAAVSRLGYVPRPYTPGTVQQAAENERRSLLIRFGTAAFLSMQLMGYSLALYAGYFRGMDAISHRLVQVLAALVTTPVVFYTGWPFLAGGWRSLKNRTPGMDLLVSLGVLAAYAYSLYALAVGAEVYFDSAAMIVTLVLAGRLFESTARRKASAGVDRLFRLAPDTARRLEGDIVTEVASGQLQAGDLIQIRPGERLPVDGRLLEGESEIDESAVTGESLPVLHRPGSRLVSGTMNLTTAITVRVTQVAAESFIARIARVVEEAQTRRAPVQRVADRVAALFVPLVVAAATGTWGAWLWRSGDPVTALLHAVAVLVVACPCALGLATPMAVLKASGVASGRGILFRGGDVLEACSGLTTVVFDKTGTLTEGRPRVVSIEPVHGSELRLLALAAEAESGSAHPLARGILDEARRRGLSQAGSGGSRAVAGRGLSLDTEGGLLTVGSRLFLQDLGISPSLDASPDQMTEVHVALDSEYQGRLLLEDSLRPLAGATVARLHRLGLKTALLTGDREEAGRRMAHRLGLKDFRAGIGPEEKAEWVCAKQKRGERVLMVGDGINDAPALSIAAVGCAMAGGTDVALESSDLVLTRPDLERLVEALEISRRTLRIIRQNLFWAFSYNLLAIPLAIGGLLAPVHAAAAMALSSVCVVGNSLRLGKIADRRTSEPGDAGNLESTMSILRAPAED